MLNTGQQIGGAIGLAAIGTMAWTSVAHSVTHQMAAAAAAGGTAASSAAGSASSAVPGVPTAVLDHALTVGFSTGLLVAAGVVLSGFVVALITTRTPGRFALSSAVYEDREEPCDEVLGTC